MKAVTQFLLVSINRVSSEDYISVTCKSINSDNKFYPLIKGDNAYKESLWQYCQCNLRELFVNIEHDGLIDNSTPINPLAISIESY